MSTQLARSHAGMSPAQVDKWRAKLNVGAAIRKLNECIDGKVELTTARMKAIEITLRKTIPDLSSVEVRPVNADGMTFVWGVPTVQGNVIEGEAKHINAGNAPDTQTKQTDQDDQHVRDTADNDGNEVGG